MIHSDFLTATAPKTDDLLVLRRYSDSGMPEPVRGVKTFRAKFVGETCWIISEVTWILLIPQVCILAGFLAFGFLACSTVSKIRVGFQVENWIAEALATYWLFVNLIWMSEECLLDTPDQPTPWSLTPMGHENEELYSSIQALCINGFYVTPIVWLLVVVFLHLSGGTAWSSGRSRGRIVFYEAGYVAIWSLMDGLWAAQLLWPAIASCVFTIFFILKTAAEETGLGWRGIDRTDIVWVLWTISNLFWILLEVAYDDDMNLRYVAALIGVLSLLLLQLSWARLKDRSGLPPGILQLGMPPEGSPPLRTCS